MNSHFYRIWERVTSEQLKLIKFEILKGVYVFCIAYNALSYPERIEELDKLFYKRTLMMLSYRFF